MAMMKKLLVLFIILTYIAFVIYQLTSIRPNETVVNLMIVKNEKLKEEISTSPDPVFGTYKENSETYYKCIEQECAVLAVVSCGSRKERLQQLQVMLKSAIVLSKYGIVFELFTDRELYKTWRDMEENWPESVRKRVRLNLRVASYPEKFSAWKTWFRPCATMRLFLPSLLPEVDALIYMDSDVLFTGPVEGIWNLFSQMNSTQMAALANESEDETVAWYPRVAVHPYYGKFGLNAGIMLMNLTRLREFNFEDYYAPVESQFHSNLPFADQDIMNIIFHYHPDRLLNMGCEFNYRTYHCKTSNSCKTAIKNGVFVAHGSSKTFSDGQHPVFNALFYVFEKFDFEDKIKENLYIPLKLIFSTLPTKPNCPNRHEELLKNIEKIAYPKPEESKNINVRNLEY